MKMAYTVHLLETDDEYLNLKENYVLGILFV